MVNLLAELIDFLNLFAKMENSANNKNFKNHERENTC